MTKRSIRSVREALARRVRRGVRATLQPLADVAGTLTGVETDRPMAALTFDEGPHPEVTPRLLDVLAAHGARATFFCVGKFAAENRNVLRRMHEEGHVVANHTWDHPSMPHVSRRERRRQLDLCARALEPYEAAYFRPPYGHQSLASHFDTLRRGYDVVGWRVEGQDWLDHDASRIAARIGRNLRPGDIVLLHDRILSAPDVAFLDRAPTLAAVERLLEGPGRDFEFVTVPELLGRGRPRRVHWYRSADDFEWLNSLEAPDGEAWRYPA